MLLLLMLIKEVIAPLHSLISVMFYFLLMSMLFSTLLMPFVKQLIGIFDYMPHAKAMIVSAVLFYFGQLLYTLLEENEYAAIAELMFSAVKILIVSYWLKQFIDVLKEVSVILQRLN